MNLKSIFLYFIVSIAECSLTSTQYKPQSSLSSLVLRRLFPTTLFSQYNQMSLQNQRKSTLSPLSSSLLFMTFMVSNDVIEEVPEKDSEKDSKRTDNITKKKKPTKKKLTLEETTGFTFSDEVGDYDVPIVKVPMWYRISVRKSSEKRLCDEVMALRKESPKWAAMVEDAIFPHSYYVRFKGKQLTYAEKPLIPGIIYIKMKMGPDYADMIESIKGIYGFTKTNSRLNVVLPLPPEDAEKLEDLKNRKAPAMDDHIKKLKKEDYVSIISGRHKGKYGILMGTSKGRLDVCLRSDYKDEWDSFDIDEVEYLSQPPEKNWKNLSAKEAVLSLMSKDRYNPTIKALKRSGLLDEILTDGDQTMLQPRRQSIRRPDFTYENQDENERNSFIEEEDRVQGNQPYKRQESRDEKPIGGTVKRIRSIAKSESSIGGNSNKFIEKVWKKSSIGSENIPSFKSVEEFTQNRKDSFESMNDSKFNQKTKDNNNAAAADDDGDQDLNSLLDDLLNDINSSNETTEKPFISKNSKDRFNDNDDNNDKDQEDDILGDLLHDLEMSKSFSTSISKAKSKSTSKSTSDITVKVNQMNNDSPKIVSTMSTSIENTKPSEIKLEASLYDDDFNIDDLFGEDMVDDIKDIMKMEEQSETKSTSTVSFNSNSKLNGKSDKNSNSNSNININSKVISNKNSAKTTNQPRMEDFGSFEEYLDALVTYEKSNNGNMKIGSKDKFIEDSNFDRKENKSNDKYVTKPQDINFDDDFMTLFSGFNDDGQNAFDSSSYGLDLGSDSSRDNNNKSNPGNGLTSNFYDTIDNNNVADKPKRSKSTKSTQSIENKDKSSKSTENEMKRVWTPRSKTDESDEKEPIQNKPKN